MSLCLPYRGDLSRRFFDAWLTGQIPIVTPDIAELTSDLAARNHNRHFLCARSDSPKDIEVAHHHALDLFRTGGVEGQRQRHEMVLREHMCHHRVEQILTMLRDAAVQLTNGHVES